MSAHKEFLEEKEKIDKLINEGYRITAVNENLSGAFVQFERTGESNQPEIEELHILTADARKYFSNIIIAEQRAL